MNRDSDNNHWLTRIQNTVWNLARIPDRAVTVSTSPEVAIRNRVRKVAGDRVSGTLRQLRADQGYSYEQLRDMTGLSLQILYDIEFKKRRLTLHELELLAQCYKLSASDILGIDLE